MGNNAINTNPPTGVDIHITRGGSSWLWACFSIFGLAAIASVLLGARRAAGDRLFNYIITTITIVSAIAYFSMASNLGYTGVVVEFLRLDRAGVSGFSRQVFWVRYVQYFINLPLIVLALALTARLPTAQLAFTLFATAVTVVCMLVGALTSTIYKWGFFVIGLVISIYVFYAILHSGRRYAIGLGADVGKAYQLPTILFTSLMLLYPIAWGLSEGGNVISPNAEAVFYGILDLFLFLGFAGILVFGHRNIAPSQLGLRMRTHDEELTSYYHSPLAEKTKRAGDEAHEVNGVNNHQHAAASHNGLVNGTNNDTLNGTNGHVHSSGLHNTTLNGSGLNDQVGNDDSLGRSTIDSRI